MPNSWMSRGLNSSTYLKCFRVTEELVIVAPSTSARVFEALLNSEAVPEPMIGTKTVLPARPTEAERLTEMLLRMGSLPATVWTM